MGLSIDDITRKEKGNVEVFSEDIGENDLKFTTLDPAQEHTVKFKDLSLKTQSVLLDMINYRALASHYGAPSGITKAQSETDYALYQDIKSRSQQ